MYGVRIGMVVTLRWLDGLSGAPGALTFYPGAAYTGALCVTFY